MEKEKAVDYFRVMRDFDKSQGKAPDDFDFPLKSSEEPDGGVDYLSCFPEMEGVSGRTT